MEEVREWFKSEGTCVHKILPKGKAPTKMFGRCTGHTRFADCENKLIAEKDSITGLWSVFSNGTPHVHDPMHETYKNGIPSLAQQTILDTLLASSSVTPRKCRKLVRTLSVTTRILAHIGPPGHLPTSLNLCGPHTPASLLSS